MREKERAARPLAWKAVGGRAELGRKQWPLSLVNDATPASAAASSSVVLAALRRVSRCACRDYRVCRAILKRRRSRSRHREKDDRVRTLGRCYGFGGLSILEQFRDCLRLLIRFNFDCSNAVNESVGLEVRTITNKVISCRFDRVLGKLCEFN